VLTDKFGAKTDKDFAPDDPANTFNYFQPRTDPFSIPNQIPEELRPKLTGTGLEGTADPELLKQLIMSTYTADLRMVPIIVIGVLENGQYRGCIYTIAGNGWTSFLQEGGQQCAQAGGFPPFTITASQISEDYVVLTLTGGCGYAMTDPVVRTFHVSR